MKIATTTADFSQYYANDADKIRELHRAGFRYIDLSMFSMRSDSVYMQSDWKNEVAKLKQLATELDMQFVQSHAPSTNFLTDDAEKQKEIAAALIRCFEVCRELGISTSVIHNGRKKGISKEETFEKNRAFYLRVLPYAEACGVNLLVENSTKINMGETYYPNSGKELKELLSFVAHPFLHACWDTGHANCEGSQYEDIVTLGSDLYAIHYNDNVGNSDQHLLPFLGTMNHDEVIHALLDIGYQGYFTLECDGTLRPFDCWIGNRRRFEGDDRLSHPQLFMRRRLEKLLYETAEYLLNTYGILEN